MKSWLLLVFFFSGSIFFSTMSLLSLSHISGGLYFTLFNSLLALIIGLTFLRELFAKKIFINIKRIQLISITAILLISILFGYAMFYPAEFVGTILNYFIAFTLPAILLGLILTKEDLLLAFSRMKYLNIYLSLTIGASFLNARNFESGRFLEMGGASHLTIGYTMAALFAYNIIIFLHAPQKNYKVFAAGLMMFNLMIIIFSGSRGALLSLILVFLLVVLSNSNKKKHFIPITVLLGALTIAINSIINTPQFAVAIERISNGVINSQQDQSSQERIQLYEIAYNNFLENPIVGNGVGSFSKEMGMYYYPHNIFLEIMNDFGLIGVTAAGFIIFSLIGRSVKILNTDYRFHIIVYWFLGMLVQSMITGSYLVNSKFWITFVIIWLFTKDKIKKNVVIN
ncbi:O-antigen ligase family protein [Planococcus plakortidis]|uniref:O-antigen ligase family protein n=1 Tax=Planococcus plakortidis TaxID=1038856 RepID=UPI003858E8CA